MFIGNYQAFGGQVKTSTTTKWGGNLQDPKFPGGVHSAKVGNYSLCSEITPYGRVIRSFVAVITRLRLV